MRPAAASRPWPPGSQRAAIDLFDEGMSILVRPSAGVGTVVIDSLTGYLMSMADEAGLMAPIRGPRTFPGSRGVTTVLVSERPTALARVRG